MENTSTTPAIKEETSHLSAREKLKLKMNNKRKRRTSVTEQSPQQTMQKIKVEHIEKPQENASSPQHPTLEVLIHALES